MRQRKCIIVLVILVLSSIVLSSCKAKPDSSSIFNSNGVKVSVVDAQVPKNFVKYEWSQLTEDIVYKNNNLIVSGIVSNVREVMIEYQYNDADVKDNVTLFDFAISNELYASDEYPIGNTVTVGVPYNSYTYGEWLPVIEEGKEFILFAFNTSGYENNILRLDEYVEYWVTSPNSLLVERIGNHYVADKFFSQYTESAQSLIECMGISENQLSVVMANIDEINNVIIDVNNGNLSIDNIPIENVELTNTIDYIQATAASKNVDNPFEVLTTLLNRSEAGTTELWLNISSTYVFECDAFENAIIKKKANFIRR